MKILRQRTNKQDADKLIRAITDIDHAIVHLVARTQCMTLAAADDLVGMQRRLRKMRYQIETERSRVPLDANPHG